MQRSKMCLLGLTLAISFAYYYFHSLSLTTQSSKIPISTSTVSTLKFQPSKYKVVTMNDRVPFYELATIDGNKPYADGDRAQATIFHSLQLTQKCKQDPSLIVVDIGGFLGRCTYSPCILIIHNMPISLHRRLWTLCSCMWLSRVHFRSPTRNG